MVKDLKWTEGTFGNGGAYESRRRSRRSRLDSFCQIDLAYQYRCRKQRNPGYFSSHNESPLRPELWTQMHTVRHVDTRIKQQSAELQPVPLLAVKCCVLPWLRGTIPQFPPTKSGEHDG